MSKFKEEHILLISPGSHTTLAQLGLSDQIIPAKLRVATRVFAAANPGEFEPHKVRAKTIRISKPAVAPTSEQDASNNAEQQAAPDTAQADAAASGVQPAAGEVEDDEVVWEEDMDDDDGAIYPIQQGNIVNMPALLALLTHIDNQLSPPIHSPVLIVCDPNWTPSDKEAIAQFYFQTYSRPAVAMVDSALSIASAYGVMDALVIDMGKDKTSVTAVTEFFVNDTGRQPCIDGVGGVAINASLMANRELALEQSKINGPKFTYDMAEQLKRQTHLCEVLSFGTPLPAGDANPNSSTGNPAAVASTGIDAGDKVAVSDPVVPANLPRALGTDAPSGIEEIPEQEGVLDVATIVVSGKTNEFLAKREQEQATRAPKPGTKKGAQEPPKPARIPNFQKPIVTFRYQERIKASELNGTNGDSTTLYPDDAYIYQTKETEVGIERFSGCNDEDFLWPLANGVLSVLEAAPIEKRNELASSIIIVGNGSKVKGLKDRIMSFLDTTIKISMSNASIFTSEFPSNFSTPLATGANTPLPQASALNHRSGGTPTPGPSSAVNPLLLAATTASQHNLAHPSSQPFQASLQPGHATPGGHGQHMPSFPSHQAQQGPTAVRLTSPKDYFSEWKEHGLEEANFLGAQVMSRTIFTMDSGPQLSYMTRQNFNEEGPMGIHAYYLG